MTTLPYRAWTASGDSYDIDFPLHDETVDAGRVGEMVSALLDAIERDIVKVGETSNGDVLQAFAMAMAVRARMIRAPQPVVDKLSGDLLRAALDAVAAAGHSHQKAGRA
ncbi:hypothetical protein ACFOGJ_15640 [Marinibaculum pumilum]|uniref:Uncharacterized protein n=1 Tax=Marinibaculum pumilum TaxID=1766165 RepID=A0ABV7L1X8_9PROT